MNVFNRIKVWWKSKTPMEKVLFTFGGITAAASVAGVAATVYTKYTSKDDGEDVPENNVPAEWINDPPGSICQA